MAFDCLVFSRSPLRAIADSFTTPFDANPQAAIAVVNSNILKLCCDIIPAVPLSRLTNLGLSMVKVMEFLLGIDLKCTDADRFDLRLRNIGLSNTDIVITAQAQRYIPFLAREDPRTYLLRLHHSTALENAGPSRSYGQKLASYQFAYRVLPFTPLPSIRAHNSSTNNQLGCPMTLFDLATEHYPSLSIQSYKKMPIERKCMFAAELGTILRDIFHVRSAIPGTLHASNPGASPDEIVSSITIRPLPVYIDSLQACRSKDSLILDDVSLHGIMPESDFQVKKISSLFEIQFERWLELSLRTYHDRVASSRLTLVEDNRLRRHIYHIRILLAFTRNIASSIVNLTPSCSNGQYALCHYPGTSPATSNFLVSGNVTTQDRCPDSSMITAIHNGWDSMYFGPVWQNCLLPSWLWTFSWQQQSSGEDAAQVTLTPARQRVYDAFAHAVGAEWMHLATSSHIAVFQRLWEFALHGVQTDQHARDLRQMLRDWDRCSPDTAGLQDIWRMVLAIDRLL